MPEPDTKYHWKPDEGVSEGLQRIVSEQLQAAIWQLSPKALSLDNAVHEARKSLKKARSAMRLVHGSFGTHYEKLYRLENSVLRDAGRSLSPLRDAQALIEVFDQINGQYREKLGDRSLVSIREGLVARKQGLKQEFESKRVRAKVLKTLRESAGRVEKWKLKKGDFESISSGFATTIRRNQKASKAASSPDSFHEWRKRVKDLRYQYSLLNKAWPAVFEGYEQAAKDLEQRLGDDHNLVVLRKTVLENPKDFGAEEDVNAMIDLIDEQQKKIRKDSKAHAIRLYFDKPVQWRKRLDRYWAAAQAE